MDSMVDCKEASVETSERIVMAVSNSAPSDTRRDIAILLYRVDELQQQVRNISSEMECEFKSIAAALKGNGKPGLEQRTTELERQIELLIKAVEKQSIVMSAHFDEHRKETEKVLEEKNALEKERRDMTNKIVLAVISMIVTNLGVIITAAIMYRLGMP